MYVPWFAGDSLLCCLEVLSLTLTKEIVRVNFTSKWTNQLSLNLQIALVGIVTMYFDRDTVYTL